MLDPFMDYVQPKQESLRNFRPNVAVVCERRSQEGNGLLLSQEGCETFGDIYPYIDAVATVVPAIDKFPWEHRLLRITTQRNPNESSHVRRVSNGPTHSHVTQPNPTKHVDSVSPRPRNTLIDILPFMPSLCLPHFLR